MDLLRLKSLKTSRSSKPAGYTANKVRRATPGPSYLGIPAWATQSTSAI